jgi:hypothetical protein
LDLGELGIGEQKVLLNLSPAPGAPLLPDANALVSTFSLLPCSFPEIKKAKAKKGELLLPF